jgi:hypothetical protein
MWGYQRITNSSCPHISAGLLLVSVQYFFSYDLQIKSFQTHVDMDIFSSFGMWNLCPEFVCLFQLHTVCVCVCVCVCRERMSGGEGEILFFLILLWKVMGQEL